MQFAKMDWGPHSGPNWASHQRHSTQHLPKKMSKGSDAAPPTAGVGEAVGDGTPPGPAAAAGARNCFPHGHFTTLPAASEGIFKIALHAGHLIFIFVAINEQYSQPELRVSIESIPDQKSSLCRSVISASPDLTRPKVFDPRDTLRNFPLSQTRFI